MVVYVKSIMKPEMLWPMVSKTHYEYTIKYEHGKKTGLRFKEPDFNKIFNGDEYIIYSNGTETFAVNKKCSKPFITGNSYSIVISVRCECKKYPNIEKNKETIEKVFALYEINRKNSYWKKNLTKLNKNIIIDGLKMFDLLNTRNILKIIRNIERGNEGKVLKFLSPETSIEDKLLYCELEDDENLSNLRYYISLLDVCPDKIVLN